MPFLLSLGLLAAPPIEPALEIVVTAPCALTARQLRPALRTYRNGRSARAPDSRLFFEDDPGARRDGVSVSALRLRTAKRLVPIPADAEGRFAFPAIRGDDWAIVGPCRDGVLPVSPLVMSPGTSAADRRLGLVADDGDVADAHPADVGDRVRQAGFEMADAQAVLAQRGLLRVVEARGAHHRRHAVAHARGRLGKRAGRSREIDEDVARREGGVDVAADGDRMARRYRRAERRAARCIEGRGQHEARVGQHGRHQPASHAPAGAGDHDAQRAVRHGSGWPGEAGCPIALTAWGAPRDRISC